MKQTILDMVKSIMSDMDSDEITSVQDTPEALQVVSTIKDVYDQMLSNQIVPERYSLAKLDTVNLVAHAGAINYLEIPDTVAKMVTLQYDIRHQVSDAPVFQEIEYLEPEAFLKLVSKNLSDQGNVTQVTDPSSGVTYYVVNDQAPKWWTSFDDHYIAFDMYDSTADATQIVGTKTVCWVQLNQDFPTDPDDYDDFIPLIDDNMFPYLLAEAKSTCFINMKQQANAKVEKQSRDQRIRLQNHRFRTKASEKASTGSTGPNYGRR